jgi:hypothetical protein
MTWRAERLQTETLSNFEQTPPGEFEHFYWQRRDAFCPRRAKPLPSLRKVVYRQLSWARCLIASHFKLEVVKVLQGYAIEAVKIALSGSVAGFAGDIGAVLTRQNISTILNADHQGGAGQGPREDIDEHSKKRSGP